MFLKKVLPVVIAAALVGCGGGGGSSTATPTTVSGSAVKGLVVGGDVTAYDAAGNVVGTAVTDAKGEYSITLAASYTGGPLRIEVQGKDGATMICDVAGGCDVDGDGFTDNIFGATIDLDSSFKLKAVIPATTETQVKTQITALTDMAANLAVANSTGGVLVADAVSSANSQVANMFSMTTEALLTAKPVDITDPAAIATATVEELRSALYSAAILGAVLKSDRPAGADADDIGAALKAFADDFAANDGQLVANDDAAGGDENTTTVSFEDVLEQATALTKEGSVSAAVTSTDSAIEQDISDDLDVASNDTKSPVGELTDAQPSPEATSEALQQAQAMIADLRGLAYALGATQGNTANQEMQALVDGGDLFADKLSMAGDVTGPAADYLLDALNMATAAMAGAADQYTKDWQAVRDGVSGAAIRTVFEDIETGISVTIAPETNSTAVTLNVLAEELNVDGSYIGIDGINLVAVDLAFTLTQQGIEAFIDSVNETGTSSSGAGSLVLDATLAGSLTSSTAKLTVLNTSDQPSKIHIDARNVAWTDTFSDSPTPAIYSETALINVDGSLADWSAATPYWESTQVDATGDTDDRVTGTVAPGTDIEKAYFRASPLQLGFGIQLTESPVYPHTTGVFRSRYEIMMRAFSDDSCSVAYGLPAAETSEPGVPHYFLLRNSYETSGHRSFLMAFEGDGETDVEINGRWGIDNLPTTASGELVELLVPQAYLPRQVNSVLAQARVRYTVEQGDRRIVIDRAPDVCVPLQERLTIVDGSYQGTWGIAPSDLSLKLAAKLEQLPSESVLTPAAFEGTFSVALTGLDFDGSDRGGEWQVEQNTSGASSSFEGRAETEDGRFSFATMSLGLSGTFSRGDDAFDARFSVDLSGTGFEATHTLDFAWWDVRDANDDWVGGDHLDVETTKTTGIITGSAMLSFEATIAGVSNSPAKIQLEMARTTETTGTAGLTLTLGADGKRLELDSVLEDGADSANPDDIVPTSVTITNQDGIVITLKDPAAVEDNISTITKGAEQLGTVTEESGMVTFRLRDGSNSDVTIVETL